MGRARDQEGDVEHHLVTGIQARADAAAFAGAGADHLSLRVDGDTGPCPIAVVEGVSEDRDWAPFHSHPWDEVTYVLEGEMEFRVGDTEGTGAAGAVVTLPRGVPHTLRVPHGTARYLMVTIGAPSVDFLREVGEAYADGPTLERLIEIARRHGVVPVAD
jgi:mannose-6-phosphate isomerase-like protein (cupin superfamily)